MTKKPKKTRNWAAVAAHFRNSAGAMNDRRKQAAKEYARKSMRDLVEEVVEEALDEQERKEEEKE